MDQNLAELPGGEAIKPIINCAAVVKHFETGNLINRVNYEGVLQWTPGEDHRDRQPELDIHFAKALEAFEDSGAQTGRPRQAPQGRNTESKV